MNLIDNGIKEVLKITPVIRDDEMYFEVEFIDYYNSKRTKNFQSTKDIENRSWME